MQEFKIICNQPLTNCSKMIIDFIEEGGYADDFTDLKIQNAKGEHRSEEDLVISYNQKDSVTIRFLGGEKVRSELSDLRNLLSLPSKQSLSKKKDLVISSLSSSIDIYEIEIPDDASDDLWEMLDNMIAHTMKKYEGILDCRDGFFDKDLKPIFKL